MLENTIEQTPFRATARDSGGNGVRSRVESLPITAAAMLLPEGGSCRYFNPENGIVTAGPAFLESADV